MSDRYNIDNIEHQYKKHLFSKSLSKNTIKNYLSDIRYFISYSNLSDISHITNETFNNYKQFLVDSDLPPKSIQRRLTSASLFIKFLIHKIGLKFDTEPTKPVLKNNIVDVYIKKDEKYVKHLGLENKSNYNGILFGFGNLILVILASIALYTGYESNLLNIKKSATAQINIENSGRSIHYVGTIKDALGNKIDTKTDLTFSIYNNQNASSPVYIGACKGENGLTPSVSGKIDINIGKDCGMKPIPYDLFIKEPTIYLGIKIGSDKEVSPRTQVPNTAYSLNSEQLQGFTIGNSENSIPYINDRGSIILGSDSPALFSLSEETPLTIESSENLILKSGFNADLQFEAQESGNIEFRTGGFSESTPQMYISNFGNVGVGTVSPEEYKLQVAGDVGPDSDSIYDLGSDTSQWSNIYASNFLQNGVPLCDKEGNNCPIDNVWINSKPYIYQNDTSQKIGIGSSAADSIESQLYVTRDILKGTTGKALAIFNQTENQDIFTASASGSLRFVIKNSGNTGIGTINPSAKLDVSGGQTKIEVSSQYGQKLCHSGTNSTNTQNVVLGDCDTSSADLAEYYGTDDSSLEAGDLVSPGKPGALEEKSSKAYVMKTPADGQNFIGVVSTNPYEVFGNNFSAEEKKVPVALSGRVPLKIAADSEDISSGDPITASSTPGRATKAVRPGRIIGFALNNWSKNDPESRLITFINPGWHDPRSLINHEGELVSNNGGKDIPYIYYGTINTGQDNQGSGIMEKLVGRVEKSMAYINSDLFVSGKIISPLLETENFIASGEAHINTVSTNKIKPSADNLVIDIGQESNSNNNSNTDDKLTEVIIQGLDRMKAATIDSLGNATFSGTLTADNIDVRNNLSTKKVRSEIVNTNGIISQDATVSGTLIADNIQSNTISQINSKIDSIESSASSYIKSLESKNDLAMERLNTTVNELQNILADMKNNSLPNTAQTSLITDGSIKLNSLTDNLDQISVDRKVNTFDQAYIETDDLRVNDVANLFNANVTGSLVAGSLLIEDNSILSLAWDLKLSSLGTISFFDGSVKFTKDGSIEANGNIIAKSGITTNELSPIDNSLTIKLNKKDKVQNDSDVINESRVMIANAAGETVGSITDQGVATFKGLVLDSFTDTSVTRITSPAENLSKNGEFTHSIETDKKTAGVGLLPENETEVILYNEKINGDSLVYLTIAGSITDTQLTVVKKETCATDSGDPIQSCKPYFKVAASNASHPEIRFNWLIIN